MQQKSLRIAAIIAMLLAGVALQGCGTPRSSGIASSGPPPLPAYDPTNCVGTDGNCKINVFVDKCSDERGIRVEPTYASTNSNARIIIWTIKTPPYAFASNGIDFGANTSFIPLPNQPHPPSEFRVRNDAGSGVGAYYYVNIVGCKQVDPWIKNN